jgi:hypothetical protein
MLLLVKMMEQPTLFERRPKTGSEREILLFALGDFQSRGKLLAGRELALDRLLGAVRRAEHFYDAGSLADEQIIAALRDLGAKVYEVPRFVAKHPYRIVVPEDVAISANVFYRQCKSAESR